VVDVFDMANFFIQASVRQEENDMTNLKLNKLLYYVQGVFLARTGRPLFADDIEAWSFGPVVPVVYQRYKICGKNPIATDDASGVDVWETFQKLSKEEKDVFFDVMREYAVFTAACLVNKTHAQGTPWSNTPRNAIISQDEMLRYFRECERVPTFSEIAERIPTADKFPSDWYDPDEDAVWEAYL
jgi:uncharacterized phage-associated protein